MLNYYRQKTIIIKNIQGFIKKEITLKEKPRNLVKSTIVFYNHTHTHRFICTYI